MRSFNRLRLWCLIEILGACVVWTLSQARADGPAKATTQPVAPATQVSKTEPKELSSLFADLPEDCRPRNGGDAVRIKRLKEWLPKHLIGQRVSIKTRMQIQIYQMLPPSQLFKAEIRCSSEIKLSEAFTISFPWLAIVAEIDDKTGDWLGGLQEKDLTLEGKIQSVSIGWSSELRIVDVKLEGKAIGSDFFEPPPLELKDIFPPVDQSPYSRDSELEKKKEEIGRRMEGGK